MTIYQGCRGCGIIYFVINQLSEVFNISLSTVGIGEERRRHAVVALSVWVHVPLKIDVVVVEDRRAQP